MIPHRLRAKYFVTDPDAVELPALIPVFHRWIQEQRLDELLIDVADYKHVHEGPGIMLIGHEGEYALDLERGHPGLSYTRKRARGNDLSDALRIVLRQVLTGARLLEEDETLDLRFVPDTVEVTFLDRLRVPNQSDTVDVVVPAIEALLRDVHGETEVRLEWLDRDERKPFAIRAQVADPAALDIQLDRLAQQHA